MKSKKGGNFERSICKLLSQWFSTSMLNCDRNDIFWRTAGSGARATVRSKQGLSTKNSCGDICALDENASKFIECCIIELKRGYSKGTSKNNISILSILDSKITKRNNKNALLIRWIEKASIEAKENGRKHVIIIFRRDNKNSCIVLNKNTFNMLEKRKHFEGSTVEVKTKNLNFMLLVLDDFLKWCSPKDFIDNHLIKRRRENGKASKEEKKCIRFNQNSKNKEK